MDTQNETDKSSTNSPQENPSTLPITHEPTPPIIYHPTAQPTDISSIDNQPSTQQQQTTAQMPSAQSTIPINNKRTSGSFTSTSYVGLIVTCSLIAFLVLIGMSAGPGGIGPALMAVSLLPIAFVFLILTLVAASKNIFKSNKSGLNKRLLDIVMFVISFSVVAFIIGAGLSSVVTNKLRDNRCEQNAASGKYVSSEFADIPWRDTECDGLVEEY